MFELQSISYTAHDTPILYDVSLSVAPCQVVGLLGASGCGKTTLFNIASGLMHPKGGRVYLNGDDITGQPGHIAYMLQKDLLLEHKRVIDNVALPLLLQGEPKDKARQRAQEALGQFGLAEVGLKWPWELSGGMRQRAALARATLSGQAYWLLDEPFSALDALTRRSLQLWFLDMVAKLKRSCLLITHDVDEALLMCDAIYYLKGNPQAGQASRLHYFSNLQAEMPQSERYQLKDDLLARL